MEIPSIVKHTRCWNCGFENDRVTSANPREALTEPRNGDITMCIECGEFAIFDSSFPDGVRKPNPAENFEMKRSKELAFVKAAWEFATRHGRG